MKSLIIACGTIFLLFVGAFFGSYALSISALNTSQHDWCSSLSILTGHAVPKPANPAANPSRVQSYQFYVNLKTLERRYHC
jgi:hypothetical protein